MSASDDEIQENQIEESPSSSKTSWLVGGASALVLCPFLDLVFAWGASGIAIGGLGAGAIGYVYGPKVEEWLERRGIAPTSLPSHHLKKINWKRLSTPTYLLEEQAKTKIVDADTVDQPSEDTTIVDDSLQGQSTSEEDPLFALPSADDTGGVRRFTVDEIVSHIQSNSYKIFVGRSMTKTNNPAVAVNIYKQHFRFIGASQRGKSSMVAAFIDIVTRTHDRDHVLLALLDKEDQTSKLFAHLPHILKIQHGDKLIKFYARNDDEVLERLIDLVMIMNSRYQMKKTDIVKQPIILVYVEEFLSLKNTFKSRMDKAKAKKDEDAKAKAVSDYQTLVYCIEEICQRGLKVRIQLLFCAQVEYADDDFKEAMVSVGCGFSFCVRPKAAESAGFKNYPLLKKNAEDNKVGQAVVETPDCNDLVLAPEYPLEDRLIALEKAEAETSPAPPLAREVVTDQLLNYSEQLQLTVSQLRALPYSEYLKTDHWQQQRRSALLRAGYACQVCNVTNTQLETHHRTYERLGCELPEDLFVLCRDCHELFSKNGKLAQPNQGSERVSHLRIVQDDSRTHRNPSNYRRSGDFQNVPETFRESDSPSQNLGSSEKFQYVLADIVDEPVEVTEPIQNVFVPGSEDKLLNDFRTQLLITYYEDCHNVKLALKRIKNDKGEGLGMGYYRHACWILDSLGKRKRA